MTATASAQDYGQTATLKIWDNTTAPHSNGITTPETEKEPNRLANTSDAELYIFPADKAKTTGQAVVICPGGGYGMLAMDHEGYEMAKWFAANGITGAVLKYRMPNHHPEVPLEDAVQALRIMAPRATRRTKWASSALRPADTSRRWPRRSAVSNRPSRSSSTRSSRPCRANATRDRSSTC